MPFNLVNTVQTGTDPATGSIALNLGTLGAGNGVIVGVSMLDSTSITVSGVSCGGEALTATSAIYRVTSGSGAAGSLQFWYLSGVTSGGSKTVTVTLSSATNTTEAFAFAVDGSIELDSGQDQTATGSGTTASVGLTTSQANALIVAAAISGYANGDLTPDGAYTGIALLNWDGNSGGQYDLDVGAAGSKTVQMTTAGSGPWAIKAAAFIAAGPAGYTLTCDPASFTLTGQAAEFSKNLGSATDVGGLVIGSETSFVGEGYVGANEAPAGGSPYTMVASAGSFTLSGQDATLQWDQTLVAAAGSFTLTGQAATLRRGISMSAAAGSFTLSGQAATTRQGYVLTAAAGSFTLTGSDAARDLAMSAAAGSFTLSGQDATLTYTPAGADPVLTADAGTFTLTGQAATLRFGHVMPAAAGSFSLTGQDATLTDSGANPVLTADAGSFALNGQAAALRAARVLAFAAGSFTLTGQAATLLTAHRIAADAGSFALTGQDATLTPDVAVLLTAEAGSFTLTGGDADLVAPSAVVIGSGGGGGGGRIWYQGQKPRAKRKTLGDLANRLIDETLAETIYRDIAKAGEGAAVAKAVKPHAETRAAQPPPETVDWDALARDAAAVGALLQTWRRIERQREIDEDDEDWLLM